MATVALRSEPTWSRPLRDAALVGSVVFVACMIGIASRPAGLLASFWPANALLLGLMVRVPRLSGPLCWIAAAIAYGIADLATGSAPADTLLLNSANIFGVVIGLVVFRRLRPEDLALQRSEAVMWVFLACVCASLASGLAGGWAMMLTMDQSLWSGFTAWFSAELANYMALLPVILTVPALPWRAVGNPLLEPERTTIGAAVEPAAALVIALTAAVAVGGPGALAFSVPVLLWCALRSGVFETALLTLASTASINVLIALGSLDIAGTTDAPHVKTSVQIGLSLMAMGPLAVASTTTVRRDLVSSLRHRATRDELTGALTRSAFLDDANSLLAEMSQQRRSVGLLMLDIDHFKTTNDRYGHAAGDAVLEVFGAVVAANLTGSALLGRLGGEEFAVLLPDATKGSAGLTAERIRAAVEATAAHHEGQSISVTVSLGVAAAVESPSSLDDLLPAADRALYAAKEAGRNRVVYS